ncbi:MAG: hypothetical protein PVI55_11395, partial [Desulfobacterales bacterium]
MELMKRSFYFLACCLWIFFIGCGHLIQNPSGSANTPLQNTVTMPLPAVNSDGGEEYNPTVASFKINGSSLDEQELGSYEEAKSEVSAKKSENVLDEALDLCQVSQE